MRHALLLFWRRKMDGYCSMVFKYNNLAQDRVPNAHIGFALEALAGHSCGLPPAASFLSLLGVKLRTRQVNLPVQAFAHQSTWL
jgi:hypothetical protein